MEFFTLAEVGTYSFNWLKVKKVHLFELDSSHSLRMTAIVSFNFSIIQATLKQFKQSLAYAYQQKTINYKQSTINYQLTHCCASSKEL